MRRAESRASSGRHAGGDVFVDLAVKVEGELIIEMRRGAFAAEEHQYSHSKLSKPAHDCFLGDGKWGRSGFAYDQVDSGRKPVPVGGFPFKLGAAGGG